MTPTKAKGLTSMSVAEEERRLLLEALTELTRQRTLGADKARIANNLSYRLAHLDGVRG